MKIELHNLTIENFKGIKQRSIDFAGANALVEGANGAGKTTLQDAFLWVLFGKNSKGETQFKNRPVVGDIPVKGLIVAVEATLSVDGVMRTFRREEHEHITKGGQVSYPKKHWVQGAPKKEYQYNEAVTSLINIDKDLAGELSTEDICKMLTDLNHFMSLPHAIRRAVLVDMKGNARTPDGFSELLPTLNGRTVAEQKKVLNDEKKAYTKERDEIEPRIDELQRGLDAYVQSDSEPELIAKRDLVNEQLEAIGDERHKLYAQSHEREVARDKLAALKSKKAEREGFLAADTSGTQTLRDEAEELRQKDADLRTELTSINGKVGTLGNNITQVQNGIEALMLTRAQIAQEYQGADADICSKCEQPWPEGKEKPGLADIKKRGEAVQADLNGLNDQLTQLNADLVEAEHARDTAVKEHDDFASRAGSRCDEIDAEIAAYQGVKPEDDQEWKNIVADIAKAEDEIGEPVAEQLAEIEARKTAAENERDTYNKALAQADSAKKAKERILELEAKEQDLSQKIADRDRQLARWESYERCESELIAEAVNGRFNHVTWRLFEERLNGGLKDICEAIYDGRPYAALSTGERIIVGIDIINALSAHYKVSVPLFVDHKESLTLPLEAETQTIELAVAEGVNELRITMKDEKERKGAA
jgi:DNA repair exonuclease SbcCD ATPase subunit